MRYRRHRASRQRSSTSDGRPAIRTGFALITALWLTVAISAVSLELSLLSRQRRLASANVLEAATARAVAEAGLETARARLARLLTEPDARTDRRRWNDARTLVDPWHDPAGLVADTIHVGERGTDIHAIVQLEDLGARLNINRATMPELQRFLAALPMDAALASRFAQRIMDWRDADDHPRPDGAEREAYVRAVAAAMPRNGEFAEVNELRQVLGMSDELFERVRRLVTVDGSARVNVNAAPRAVLLALAGMTAEAAEVAERARRTNRPIADLQAFHQMLSRPARAAIDREVTALAGRLSFTTREVSAISTGWIRGSPVRVTSEGVIVRGEGTAFMTARRTSWSGEP
jgi:general secretion pathway protein K